MLLILETAQEPETVHKGYRLNRACLPKLVQSGTFQRLTNSRNYSIREAGLLAGGSCHRAGALKQSSAWLLCFLPPGVTLPHTLSTRRQTTGLPGPEWRLQTEHKETFSFPENSSQVLVQVTRS